MTVVFIDESGDPGLKIAQGSSAIFVVTLVIFKDEITLASVDSTICRIREKLRLPESFEFHFSKLKHEWREFFFKEVNGFEFTYFSIVINKRALRGEGFQVKESFYKFACGLVLSNAAAMLEEATVVLDGCGSKDFRLELAAYLRKKLPNSEGRTIAIKKLKIEESHRNNLLQLADMVCGAVARSFSERPDANVYRRWLKPREKRVQFWPKENPGLST